MYWQTSVGTPPVRSAPDDEKEADAEAELGVLHAKLEGDTVVGRILKPHGSGKMQASLRGPLRSAALGEIEDDEQGQFSSSAAGFELDALKAGRLVLRLEKDRGSWKEFLSISATLELIRRTGSIASKPIAMLGGTDTPEDMAAILARFKEDPRRLPAIASVSGGGSSAAENTTQGTTFITLSDLTTGLAGNPVTLLRDIQTELQRRPRDPTQLVAALIHGLAFSLAEAPSEAHQVESSDRLPLTRARKDADSRKHLTPGEFLIRLIGNWIMAQHAYWSVGRDLADAGTRGKQIMRLRIVMDEGGWTLTPGTTTMGNPPKPTPDRLETAVSLLTECRRFEEINP
ncbi:hypothetical protein [Cereibacter johrii]|uniref:hypothetical protein n=1 Tax=Cereibacter johrii TaxID=445629 RepID=UPI003CEA4020